MKLQASRRLLAAAAVAVPLLFGSAGLPALAQAASGSPSTSTSQSALNAVLQNDFEIGGQVASTVDATNLPGTLNLNASGLPLQITVNGQTTVQVGPYAADASFLLAGVSAQVWFHFDSSGNLVADLIVITPTVVKGTLTSDQNLSSQDPSTGQLLTVEVPAQNGNPAQAVNVEVLPDTVVKLLPPWNASAHLSAASQIVTVGVMNANGVLIAAMVVGVISKS